MIIRLLAATRRHRGSRFPSDLFALQAMYTVRTVNRIGTSCASAPVVKFLTRAIECTQCDHLSMQIGTRDRIRTCIPDAENVVA